MQEFSAFEPLWMELSDACIAANGDVTRGKMMSADALTFDGKVFAFWSTKGGRTGLGCRLGRDCSVDALGLSDWQHLAPFKTRPPMKDWIVVGVNDAAHWQRLIGLALDKARTARKT